MGRFTFIGALPTIEARWGLASADVFSSFANRFETLWAFGSHPPEDSQRRNGLEILKGPDCGSLNY